MADYRPSIVTDVQHSVEAINAVFLVLQRDHPLSSDILDINYSQDIVEQFFASSESIVQSLQAASLTTSNWLQETGDSISQNLSEAGQVERSIGDTTASLGEADARTRETRDRIHVLEETIRHGEESLSSAQQALWKAEDKLENERAARNIVRAGAIITFFFAPILSFALASIDILALQEAVDNRKAAISTINSQLAESHSQLQSQRESLAREHTETVRLGATISELKQRAECLSAEKQRLEVTRRDLAELSTRINDCLYTVNAALSSSKSISTMLSMRNVVSGIQGVIDALGTNAMFEGPLAQLDDAAFGALDRRVAAIRRRRRHIVV
ncbi:hypothetical protein L226DRAFT_547039 [Lentinus tigrinus ALCF2SS1-7]|uniref:Uncharacterized protein n=1 Tax=Lentinus tigrinus ALCF2SS1-6 TaxID=1328759 RepID=A0A5C2S4Y2_9APHY|nr:hypothetical protein L227DRAFT_587276 [Lentinus tigrinus ALCF2SS1-6]RPD72306.1 hypothetical protein L226DRAFT_547039 [Lentinus tigrinus ALCF2SS1-7]